MAKAITAGLLTAFSGLLLSLIPGVFHLEEDIGLHLLFRLRGPRQAPSDVVIVTLDRVSSKKLDIPTDPDKWPRSLHARLTESLSKKGASVIAFDIVFTEKHAEEEDRLFAEVIQRTQKVVLCEFIKRETLPVTDKMGAEKGDIYIESVIPPIECLSSAALALAPFPLPKVPVKVSRYWTFKTGSGDWPTLPVVVFQVYALAMYDELIRFIGNERPSLKEKLPRDRGAIVRDGRVENFIQVLRDTFKNDPSLAEDILETLERKQRDMNPRVNQILMSLIKVYRSPGSNYLNFYGPPGTITTIPYYRILDEQQKSVANIRGFDFKDKAVFVGLSERMRPEQKDGFYTVFSQPSGIDLSGVEIAATAFANLLEDNPVRPLSFAGHITLMILWGMLIGICCFLFPTIIAAGSVSGLGVIYLVAVQYQFNRTGIWYPLVVPLFFQAPLAFFGTVLWKYRETHRERQNIRRAFGTYLPNKVVDQLSANIGDIQASSQTVYWVCLFTDAGKYTMLSETMEPKELKAFMGKYYETIFTPVKQHGGIVVDVAGDSMLAVWTAPHSDAVHKHRACSAALDIAKRVHQFNQSSGRLDLPIRVGVHSGEIELGTVGAGDHYEYHAVGDIVNTASRLEDANKDLETQILASEDVLQEVDGFLTRDFGKIRPRGKLKPISVHELICRMENCEEKQKRLCERFARALSAYQRESWDEAIEIFQESLNLYGQDGPSKFFLAKCEAYKMNPPPETWNGITDL